jgi:hypothetical protein
MQEDARIRHPALVLGLTLVTCGVYGFIWLYQVTSEIKQELGREDMNPLLDLVLTIVTFGLWGIYLAYRLPHDIAQVAQRRGATVSDLSIPSLLLAVTGFWFVSIALCQHELNAAWRAGAASPPSPTTPAVAF